MRLLITMGLSLLSLCHAKAQQSNASQESPIKYFNDFQKYVYDKPNADSAFYCIQKLASNEKYIFLLRDLLHNSFAQEFIQKQRNDTAALRHQLLSNKILQKIVSDTTKLLLETVQPIYLWNKIQHNKDDLSALTNLTNQFIKDELSSEDMYKSMAGRYGLLINQIISEHKELKPLSEKLMQLINTHLINNQVVATDSTPRADLDKRAWYRYLYAYVNYIQSEQTSEPNKKESYLRTAFDYSPDLIDKNHRSAYFYDMVFLFGDEEKQTFKTDYLTFLTNTGNNKETILSALLKIALIEPEYKNKLQEYYQSNFVSAKSFHTYWMDAINSNAKANPPVLLHLLDNKPFSSKQLTGKWMLIDFWGTWCVPCREEHPAMQQFYDSIVLRNSKSISLLTIACKDAKDKVLAYTKENHFTFPVAMSDNKIEDTYHVQGYPTKILITPAGKYMIVPFGVDWVSFVRQYCNL